MAPKPLRVLYISRAHGLKAGGMERLSHHVLHGYKGSPRVQVQAIVLRTDPRRNLFFTRARSIVFLLTAVPRAISLARQADVVHLGDPVLSKIGWLVKVIWHKPVAVTVHGLDVAYPNPVYQLYLRLFFSRLDLYLPISQPTARLLDHFHLKGSVTPIRPGADDWYCPEAYTRLDLAKLLGTTLDNKVVLLTLGRLVRRKGHLWFIKHVLPHLPGHTIYAVAGTGPELNRLRTYLSTQPSLAAQVKLLGRVSSRQSRMLYNTADAFVQPNVPDKRDKEGFGLVLVEAAMCGLPVFASRLDGIRDAITPGQNGTLLPAADPGAWIQALSGYVRQPGHSPQARQFTLAHFSWEKVSQQYVAALENLAQSRFGA